MAFSPAPRERGEAVKSILTIGHNDLRVFLRDRTAFVWLLGMPLAFVFFMSFASRPQGEPYDMNPKVVVENNDGGFLGQMFAAELGRQGLWIVPPEEADESGRKIVIPSNFTESVLARKEVEISLALNSGDGNDQQTMLAELQLARAVVAFNSNLVENVTETGGRDPSAESFQRVMDEQNPVVLETSFIGRKPIPVGYNMSLPGVLVMYLLINLAIFGGAGIAAERRNGVLRRMGVNPVTKVQLMFGKLYGLILLAAVQVAFLMLLGQFVFNVNIGENIVGITITLLVFSWVAASLGLLLGFLVKSEEKVVGLALAISLPMAAIGGCWFPMEIVPEFVRNLAHAFPPAWAMDALHQLITYGGGLEAALKPIGILAIYAAGANLIAARFFRV